MIFRKEHGPANVATAIERKSRFTLLFRNNDRRSKPLMGRLIDLLSPLPQPARRSLTFACAASAWAASAWANWCRSTARSIAGSRTAGRPTCFWCSSTPAPSRPAEASTPTAGRSSSLGADSMPAWARRLASVIRSRLSKKAASRTPTSASGADWLATST
jgi:hypothetical protein